MRFSLRTLLLAMLLGGPALALSAGPAFAAENESGGVDIFGTIAPTRTGLGSKAQ